MKILLLAECHLSSPHLDWTGLFDAVVDCLVVVAVVLYFVSKTR